MATLLTIAQAVANELGLAPINAVASSQAQDTIQLLAIINAAGTELCMEHNWQSLNTEYRFTSLWHQSSATTTNGSAVITGIDDTSTFDTTYMVTGAGILQDSYILTVDSPSQVTLNQAANVDGTHTLTFGKTQYSLPSDYDRLIDRTQWDKSKHWEMLGPETAQQWQWIKSGYISTGPRIRWRLLGQKFQIWPVTSTSEYLGFEYVSNAWVTSSGGARKSSFTADDDTCMYPARLLIVMAKMKYFEIKGFDASAMTRDFIRLLNIAKAEDAGSKTLNFASRPSQVLIGLANIQDSGYGT